MARRPIPINDVSRRDLVAGVGAVSLPLIDPTARAGHIFERWRAEQVALEAELDRTPEATHPRLRERLFDRMFELERLILTTPSQELPAIRAKAEVLVWLMEMDGADALRAMRQVRDYLARQR